ncbi:MAG: ergothioneine biosynthesis protein EgtB [Bacteroidetes bacterium]|nr:MAG: ergothioneine biosynthesis protein EgtB [Bacteroidota bacterium]
MNSLIQQYKETRKFTENLCKPLAIEDYVPQPAEFVSPPKWHLAHTTWFFEELVLKQYLAEYKLFHPQYSFLFNSYYNTVGERTLRAQRGDLSRPTVEEVYAYRTYVDGFMEQCILNNFNNKDFSDLIILGLNHEQQHQELLITDLKYTLSLNPLFPVYEEGYSLVSDQQDLKNEFIEVKAGNYFIGAEEEGFSYDNEHGRHQVYLNDYKISLNLITNGEYLEFILDDGYKKFEYWHDEALSWLIENDISHPIYWHKLNGEWHQYSLAGLQKLNKNDILAHISFYEANAFALWRGQRLPTEEEWEVASDKFSWGIRWEWTQSAYTPYPAFKIAEGAVGEYNGKFMVNQKVLRGASNATYPGHSRSTYRNFFHPHLRWQLTGIRLVYDE